MKKEKKILIIQIIILLVLLLFVIFFVFNIKDKKNNLDFSIFELRENLYESFKKQNYELIDDFNSKWQDYYKNGELVIDNKVYKTGSTSYRMSLPKNGKIVGIKKDIKRQDWTKKAFHLYFKSSNWSEVDSLRLLVSTKGEFLEYFIIDLENHTVSEGDNWLEYVVDQSDFKNWTKGADWRNVNAIIVNANAKKNHNPYIWVDSLGLISTVKATPVLSITFDDGWENVYTNALPLMNKYNFKGTAFVIVEAINKKNYLKQKEIDLLALAGWDISGHDMNDLTRYSKTELLSSIKTTADYLQGRNYMGALNYAYPYGKYDDRVVVEISKYFSSSRTINGLMQPIDYISPYEINSYQITDFYKQKDIYRLIDNAKKNNAWCILTFHRIVDKPQNNMEFSTSNFENLLKYIKKSGIEVNTISKQLQQGI